jgi:hypothetical protein
MRSLPFALSFGTDLKQAIRAAAQDPRRRMVCGYCAAAIPIVPDRPDQRVRCPRCWRRQQVAETEEVPWRLSASAAAALRQTRRWLRG